MMTAIEDPAVRAYLAELRQALAQLTGKLPMQRGAGTGFPSRGNGAEFA